RLARRWRSRGAFGDEGPSLTGDVPVSIFPVSIFRYTETTFLHGTNFIVQRLQKHEPPVRWVWNREDADFPSQKAQIKCLTNPASWIDARGDWGFLTRPAPFASMCPFSLSLSSCMGWPCWPAYRGCSAGRAWLGPWRDSISSVRSASISATIGY